MQTYYEGGIVVHGSDFYLRPSDGSGHIEKYTGGKTADAQSIPYPSVQAAEGGVNVGGAGSLALAALQDGTLFAGSEDGIFKLSGEPKDSGNSWPWEWTRIFPYRTVGAWILPQWRTEHCMPCSRQMEK